MGTFPPTKFNSPERTLLLLYALCNVNRGHGDESEIDPIVSGTINQKQIFWAD
jgi:hypothetical protein